MTRSQRPFERWGPVLQKRGEPYIPLPRFVLDHIGTLGLNAQQALLLILLMDYKYWPDRDVFPLQTTLATKLGLSTRQVRTHLKKLEANGFIEIVTRSPNGRRNTYALDGLIEKLERVVLEAESEAKRNRPYGLLPR